MILLIIVCGETNRKSNEPTSKPKKKRVNVWMNMKDVQYACMRTIYLQKNEAIQGYKRIVDVLHANGLIFLLRWREGCSQRSFINFGTNSMNKSLSISQTTLQWTIPIIAVQLRTWNPQNFPSLRGRHWVQCIHLGTNNSLWWTRILGRTCQ